MEGSENKTGNGKGTMEGKWKGKGKVKDKGKAPEEAKWKGKGYGEGKDIVKQTPGGDDISRAIALQMQKEMYEADSDMEGLLEQVNLELEASPATSIPSADDTDTTEGSKRKYNPERDSDVDMPLEDDVDAPCGVELGSDVDMERDIDDEEEDEVEEDEEEEAEEEEDEDVEEDEGEDDGKEPWTIGQGEMVNTSADDVDTIVDNQHIVLPEQRQAMRRHNTLPQPPAPAPWPHTLQPCTRPRTP